MSPVIEPLSHYITLDRFALYIFLGVVLAVCLCSGIFVIRYLPVPLCHCDDGRCTPSVSPFGDPSSLSNACLGEYGTTYESVQSAPTIRPK